MKLHPEVPHPKTLQLREDLARYERGWRGKINEVNDFLLTHLAVIFGIAWTVWIFMFTTIGAYWMPASIQAHIFFFSSGCIQLFALPLMIYIQNKLQKATDLQSDAMTQAQTHIATVGDQNNELLTLVHQLLQQNTDLTQEVKAAIDNHGNTS